MTCGQIYRACGHTIICYPLLFELSDFYLAQDIALVMDDCRVSSVLCCCASGAR